MKSFQSELPVSPCRFHSLSMRGGAVSVHHIAGMAKQEQALENHGIFSGFFSFLNVF